VSHTTASLLQLYVAVKFPVEWPVKTFAPPLLVRSNNVTYGGPGRIAGTVKVKASPDTPVRRRVLLLDDRAGHCIAETWSDPTTGAYEFRNIDRRLTYTVIAYDYTKSKKLVIADNITPELMT
jgi:hypothetical protein